MLLPTPALSSQGPSAAAALHRWLQRSSLCLLGCKLNLQAGSLLLLLHVPTALCPVLGRKPHCHRADGWVLGAAHPLLLQPPWGKGRVLQQAEPPGGTAFCSRSMVRASAWGRQEGREDGALEMRSVRNFDHFPPLSSA